MELKIRVWDKQNKRMIPPEDLNSIHFDSFGKCEVCAITTWDGNTISDLDVMFWTGTKDKHGICIYDKDLVKANGCLYQIFWSGLTFSWSFKDTMYTYGLRDLFCPVDLHEGVADIEVLGNVYENIGLAMTLWAGQQL
jgi:hypothetical protein